MTISPLRTFITTLGIAAGTAIALAIPIPANATVLTFTGTPTYAGIAAGTSPGPALATASSVLSGSIVLAHDIRNGTFDANDITGFELHFGGLDFSPANLSVIPRLSGTVSDDGATLGSLFYQFTFPRLNAQCAGCSINLSLGSPYYSPDRFSLNYQTQTNGSGVVVGGVTSYPQADSRHDVDIPEPSASLMLGLGLGLIGFGVWRQRRRASYSGYGFAFPIIAE